MIYEVLTEDKYLGDVIATDGRNIKNIKSRISKGKGIVTKILTMLEGIPFGKHYFPNRLETFIISCWSVALFYGIVY